MRIAFVTSRFFPKSVGGGETHTYHLATALAGRGHDVEVVLACEDGGEPRAAYEYEGVKVSFGPADREGESEWVGDSARAWLERLCGERGVDVVHVMVWRRCRNMITAAVEMRVPLVVTLLDFNYWCPSALVRSVGGLCDGPQSLRDCHRCVFASYARLSKVQPVWVRLPAPVRRWVCGHGPESLGTLEVQWADLEGRAPSFRRLLGRHAVFVAPSRIMRRLAEENGASTDRVVDMPYGVPESFVGAGRPKKTSDVLRVGYMGRFDRGKGIHLLVQAVRSLPMEARIQLSIYGTNGEEARDYVQELHALAAGDRRIEFRRAVAQRELPRVHQELDVMVVPSTWHENATIVVLESLALGTPVIVSDVEGMAPFVEEGKTGFRVAMDDVAALSARIQWCVGHLEVVRRMSANCRPLLTIEEQASRMEDVYRLVCRERAAAPAPASGKR